MRRPITAIAATLVTIGAAAAADVTLLNRRRFAGGSAQGGEGEGSEGGLIAGSGRGHTGFQNPADQPATSQ